MNTLLSRICQQANLLAPIVANIGRAVGLLLETSLPFSAWSQPSQLSSHAESKFNQTQKKCTIITIYIYLLIID